MTTGTATAPVSRLISHLGACLGPEAAWAAALDKITQGEAALHLAVLTEPFLGWLLDGTKTVESRFAKVRCAPWGVLAEGDIIAVKRPGAGITGAFRAGPVSSYRLTPRLVAELRERYAAAIGAVDDEFWQQRAGCGYATLVQVESARPVPALPFPKKDRRGWVRLTDPGAMLPLP